MVAAGLLFFSLFALALGAPAPNALRVHHARSAAPAGYKASGAPDANDVLSLRVALKTNNTQVAQKLMDVSTPGSKSYRKFLSKAQLAELTAPSDDGLQSINAWLKKNGVTATPGATNQWLNIELPVAKANAMLDADFTVFNNPSTGVSAVRTLAYSVPESVQPYLDFIHPTTAFPVPANKGISSVHVSRGSLNSTHGPRAVDASCANAITPSCLQQFYNIPTNPATQTSKTMAVSSFVESFASAADLSSFISQFRPDITNSATFNVTSIDGGENDEAQPSTEGSLDIQYTVGVATAVPTTFFTVGSNNSGDLNGFLDLVNNLIAQDDAPSVFTTSFGFPEELVDANLANNICNAYAQLGTRGTSIFFSSGDSGVDDGQGTTCTTFRPTFPSGCPFITVVGATQGVPPESAASFSSGGFSNIFSAPAYQTNAVSSYLSGLGQTNAGLFNTSGRGYPDIAAAGTNYQVNIGGTVKAVSGTSAATPLVASMVALLNDRLVAAGESTMGFLNPFLYSTGASTFTDITSGNNPGCGTDGFPALSGWDPVTGLGTPDFDKLLSIMGL